MAGQSAKMVPVLRGEISNTQSRPLNGHPPSNLQNEQLVKIFLWFPKFLSTYRKKK